MADCEICGAHSWSAAYEGAVRDGPFGKYREGARVARCGGCGVERLEEAFCPPAEIYETDAYRAKLQEGDYFKTHDELQIYTQQALAPHSLRGAALADVGCAGGALLDHYRGVAARLIAIEPSSLHHESLRSRGYEVHRYAAEAARAGVRVDYAFSIQVIEHVGNPREFLADIGRLLAPGGRVLISTPNRDDVLLKLLPGEYRSFFYRVVHRWYFDRASLARCAELAGLQVARVRYVHRYPLSNAIGWLRDRRPQGRARLPGIDEAGDEHWRQYLVESGQTDCLYIELCTKAAASSR